MSNEVNYYAVYDIVADDFGPFFVARNDNSAYRSYELSFKDNDKLNPDDYRLYHICTFSNTLKNVDCVGKIYPVNGIEREE